MRLYLAGSLRNPSIPVIANKLREAFPFMEVFDDWYAAGAVADDAWKEYEQTKGNSYRDALSGAAAKNVFNFDKTNIEASDIFVLALPAGKSGHLELGWFLGKGRPGFILLAKDDVRWDVMYQFANGVSHCIDELVGQINKHVIEVMCPPPGPVVEYQGGSDDMKVYGEPY